MTWCALAAAAQARGAERWVGTWGAAPYAQANTRGAFAEDTTLREKVHVSVGGNALRVVLTNEFGSTDLKVGGVTVALPADGPVTGATGAASPDPTSAIRPASAVPVVFGGSPTVTIAPGALAISDPVAFKLAALSDLIVTIFLPGQKIDTITYHGFGDEANFEANGSQLNAREFDGPRITSAWRFLKGIDVSGRAAGAIVCLGDSITDGALSRFNMNRRYSDVLAARLQANPATANLGVLNEGIGGNAVLHTNSFTGPDVLERFDRDVIAQAGVRHVILLEGINDIDRIPKPLQPSDAITADDLIAAYKQLIVRAHLHGIKVIGATLTPYGGSHANSEAGEAIRTKVNEFVLHGGFFDGAVDFAKATADVDNPLRYAKAADGGDHLHPSDAGYKMMGDSIDLKLFEK